ncbi:MAG: hypothetical protein QOI15_1561 [Pseudonocardiales bacterium]|nr:hypothetical protein [Pseudonocardiales bacterium]
MMPGLPEPHRTFNVMSIVGTPGVALFANDDLVTTSPNDTAYVVSATSAMTGGQFRAYRIGAECELAPDGSRVRFAGDLVIENDGARVRVRRTHAEVDVRLDLEATDTITHFVRLPGVYRHWSRLCHASGRVGDVDVAGLATLEYACGVGTHSLLDRRLPNLPADLFTYHVLNVDDRTQLLFSHVTGPGRIPVQRAVHIRTPGSVERVRAGHRWDVDEYAPEPLVTPDGRTMRMPERFTWGATGIEVRGTAAGDWVYGLGAGYVGSYDYEGTLRGKAITGVAYIEYVDVR